MIARAATDISFQLVTDCLAIQIGLAPNHIDCGHNHAGRAESALQTVIVAKCLLHWMELPIFSETLNSGDLSAFGLHREHAA